MSWDYGLQALMDYKLIVRCAEERLLDIYMLKGAAGEMFHYSLVGVRVTFGDQSRESRNDIRIA